MSCSPIYNTHPPEHLTALVERAFELAFGDEELSSQIFALMDQLDAAVVEKGEVEGLRVRYGVDLGPKGFAVMRSSDPPTPGDHEVPDGYVEVYCRVNSGFPTDQWLGPVLVPRPSAAGEIEWETKAPVHEVDISARNEIDASQAQIAVTRRRPLLQVFPTVAAGGVFPGENTAVIHSGQSASQAFSTVAAGEFVFPGLTLSASGPSPPPPVGDHGHSGRKLSFVN